MDPRNGIFGVPSRFYIYPFTPAGGVNIICMGQYEALNGNTVDVKGATVATLNVPASRIVIALN